MAPEAPSISPNIDLIAVTGRYAARFPRTEAVARASRRSPPTLPFAHALRHPISPEVIPAWSMAIRTERLIASMDRLSLAPREGSYALPHPFISPSTRAPRLAAD